MKSFKRILALLLCVMFVVTPLFANAYVNKERSHMCRDEACGVCMNVTQCKQYLRQMKTFLIDAPTFASLDLIWIPENTQTQCSKCVHTTLVDLKVLLLN